MKKRVASAAAAGEASDFNPHPDRQRVFEGTPKPGEPMKARYFSGLYPLAGMGPLLRRRGARVGLNDARVWVALCDGRAGLEDRVDENFPCVTAVILDIYRASEYPARLAALHPDDEAAALRRSRSRFLRDEGGSVMVGVLEAWDWPTRKGLAAVREEALGYFRNQVHRADNPNLRSQRVAHRLGRGGERVQDGRGLAARGIGDELGRGRGARGLPRPRPVLQ